jgi:hypothetical protein
LTRKLASDTSREVRRGLATALAVAIAAVAPATASASVQVTFKTWKVTTKNGKQHNVAKKGTFVRCGRQVITITATYDYSGATKGKAYKEIWSLDGSDLLTAPSHWGHTSGTVHSSLNRGGDPVDDGTFKLRLRQSGKGIGSNFITIKKNGGC